MRLLAAFAIALLSCGSGALTPDAAADLSAMAPDFALPLADLSGPVDAIPRSDLSAADLAMPDLRIPTNDLFICGGSQCVFYKAYTDCINGICQIVGCVPGYADCDGNIFDGCETSTGLDPGNCGGCGKRCNGRNQTLLSCHKGICDGPCQSQWGDCNNDKLADGCETNTWNDDNNCGACGNACAGIFHGSTRCAMGKCVLRSCDGGWGDCDGNLANGCEVNTDTDNNNCGACRRGCQMALCVNGVCR